MSRRAKATARALPTRRHHAKARLISAALLVVTLAGCMAPDADQGTTTDQPALVDATGTLVEPTDTTRIVTTSVDLAETVILLGHGKHLVGVPDWIASSSGCVEVPEGAEDIPRIGRPVVISAEEALSVDPTLVLDRPFPLSPTSLADQLRPLGVDIYVYDHAERIHTPQSTFTTTAVLLDKDDHDLYRYAVLLAKEYAHDLRDTDDKIARLIDTPTGSPHVQWALGSDAPRAVYQLPAGLVAADDTTAQLLFERAGLRNIATDAGATGYVQLSPEVLATQDPERVIASCTAATNGDALYSSPRYRATTAARLGDDSFTSVDPALTGIVGPRFPRGVQGLAETVHPAAFGYLTVDVNVTLLEHPNTRSDDQAVLRIDASNSTASDGPLQLTIITATGEPVRSDQTMVDLPLPVNNDGGQGRVVTASIWLHDQAGRAETLRLRFPIPDTPTEGDTA